MINKRKCLFSPVLGILFLLSISCMKVVVDAGALFSPDSRIGTKSISIPDYGVSLNDAEVFAKAHNHNRDLCINPICSEKDTLFYICNFDDGWMIIAGDKRIPPILAEGRTGQFLVDEVPEGVFIWLGSIAEDISLLKENNPVIENENTKTWDFFSGNKGLKENNTRSGSIMKWYAVGDGPYEIGAPVDTDIVPHLITTKWGQGAPWNNKCPIDISASNRCYLGCTATAVAQLLNYTHHNLGKPNNLYHQISCSKTTVNGNTSDIGFTRSLLVADFYRWDSMPLDSNATPFVRIDFAGDLMLDIGNRFGMTYSGTGSGASLSPSAMSTYYGLSYSSGDYDYQTVSSSIHNELPVIVIAYSERHRIWPFPYYYSRGHTWLIDGLHSTTRSYEYRKFFEYSENWYNYSEVYDSFEDIQEVYHIEDPDDEVVEYYEVTTTSLLMNWGYDGAFDDCYYSIFDNDAWNANGGHHLYERTIYYNFH